MTRQAKVTCDIFIAINEGGDFEVGTDESDTAGALLENCGGVSLRIVKLKVRITPPRPIEAEIDVPDDAGKTVETEAV